MTTSVVPAGWLETTVNARGGIELATFEPIYPSMVDVVTSKDNMFTPEDAPVVLGLHGFAADSVVTWSRTRVIESLVKSGFRVILLDLRGHGRSGAPLDISSYAITYFVSDIVDVLDAYSVNRVFLMGYSLGSVISLSAATNPVFRERIQAVVAGGAGGRLLPNGSFHTLESVAMAMEEADISAVTDKRARAYRRFAEATGADLRALALLQRSLLGGVHIDLGSIHIPTLVVAGRDDFVAGSPEELARQILKGEWLQVPGNHMNALLNQSFADGVSDFLLKQSYAQVDRT